MGRFGGKYNRPLSGWDGASGVRVWYQYGRKIILHQHGT